MQSAQDNTKNQAAIVYSYLFSKHGSYYWRLKLKIGFGHDQTQTLWNPSTLVITNYAVLSRERTLDWEFNSSFSSWISPFFVVVKYFESWPLIFAGGTPNRGLPSDQNKILQTSSLTTLRLLNEAPPLPGKPFWHQLLEVVELLLAEEVQFEESGAMPIVHGATVVPEVVREHSHLTARSALVIHAEPAHFSSVNRTSNHNLISLTSA